MENVNDLIKKLSEAMQKECDHMDAQELEQIVEMKKKDIALLSTENLALNDSLGHYKRQWWDMQQRKAIEEREAQERYDKDEERWIATELELKEKNKDLVKKNVDLEERYHKLLNKIDAFHEGLFSKKVTVKDPPKAKHPLLVGNNELTNKITQEARNGDGSFNEKKAELLMEDYFFIKKAANFIGVSAPTLRNWSNEGKIKTYFHPINNFRMYHRKDLEKVLKI